MMRIGQGFDIHALVPGRPLVIGGVTIAHDRGLAGHSDADVLVHAIVDALLGAAGMGDIGRMFPDTDPQYAGADSIALLREVGNRLRAANWQVTNIDCTIIAQAPKMAPHAAAMIERMSMALAVMPSQINVKAKTAERLGFVGRGEGIAAEAIALIEPLPPRPPEP